MQYKKEIVYYFFTKILVAGIAVVALSLHTKYINPSSLGEYSLVVGLLGALISIFIGWIGSASFRYHDQYNNNKEAYYSTVIVTWFGMFILLSTTFFISKWVMGTVPIERYFVVSIVYALVRSFAELLERMLRADRRFKVYCVLLLVQSIVSVVSFLFFSVIYHMQTEALFFAAIISSLIFVILACYWTKLFSYIKIKAVSNQLIKRFVRYGVPMVGVWAVSWLLSYSDRYIINFYQSSYEVGIYDISYRLTESALGIIISSFTFAFFPILINKWNHSGKSVALTYVNNVIKYYFLIMVPSVVGLAFISNNFFGTIIDESYSGGAIVIAITGVGFFLMGFNNILYKIWQLEEKTNKVLYTNIASVIVNIILNIVMIPLYGYKVAAVTTVIGYSCATMITYIQLSKKYKLFLEYKLIIKILIALIPMVTIASVGRRFTNNLLYLIMIVLLCASMYLIVIMLFGEFKNEKEYIFNTIRNFVLDFKSEKRKG